MIKFGIKPFNEQKIIASLLKKYIDDDVIVLISDPIPQGNFINLKEGKIDLAVDYLGTLYNAVFNFEEKIPWDKKFMIERVSEALNEFGIEIINFLGFSNDFVFVSKEYLCNNLEELSKISCNFVLGCPPPFIERKDGIPILKKYYSLQFKNIIPINVNEIYESLLDNRVDIITGFKTDSKIEKYDLFIINDNRNILPPYDAILIGKNIEYSLKNKLTTFKLSDREIRHYNYLFDNGELKIDI
ncbi:MAG: hypothetical protein N3D74_02900 [Caldisericia bacterium]|nr:hypothetical protein [Caldisericia bacterium]